MKKVISAFCLCMTFITAYTQNTTYQERLYYTCKAWGFVKYYHSEVSQCKVNWDSVLIAHLPDIKVAVTKDDFNDILNHMLSAAGNMALATTPPLTPLPPELSHNLDHSWINDPILRTYDVRAFLDTIRNNFRPHPICWVQNRSSGSGGWLRFPHDSLILNIDIYTNYPSETNRLLMLFKYWNIIRYFNPYNYVLDQSWDSTLYKNVELVAGASSAAELDNLIEKITAKLDDAHVEGLTYNVNSFFNKAYKPQLLLRYMDNKYVVVKTGVSGIAVGDEIVSVDGLTTTQWEDSLRHYISAGNQDVFHRFMCVYLLGGSMGSGINIVLRNATNTTYTSNNTRGTYIYNQWFSDYYPNDTLRNTRWTTLDCNVGYVHMGNLEQADVSNMYADLQSKPAIIFDIRNYPQGTAFTLANLMYPDRRMFAHDTEPEVTYPGAFRWFEHFLGPTSNSNDYKGKIILLMNQETQSQAEYSCMIFEAMPDVVKVGSPTAGADGNISYFDLTNDMQTGFTTLGIYYPNNDSTQRIGIVPDSLVYPTQAGTRVGRDEVLEKAMQIACKVSVPDNYKNDISAKIYPNPANDILNIELPSGISASLTITEITGRVLLQTDMTAIYNSINIESLMPGVYLLKIESEEQLQTFKFIKQ